MNKPPAFQTYADDFLAGTFHFSCHEVGAYWRLLLHQWNLGSLPTSQSELVKLAGGKVSPAIRKKFKKINGRLLNVRLEKERDRQNFYRSKQAEKGRKSGESRRTTVEPRLNHGATGSQPDTPPPVGVLFEPNTNPPVSSLLSPDRTPVSPSGEGEEEKTGEMKPKGPLQLRTEGFFNRKPATPLSDKETKAFAKARRMIEATSEEDWLLLQAFYAAPDSFHRKDLMTLLNNWNGEIDRAREWKRNPQKKHEHGNHHDRNAGTYNETYDVAALESKVR